MKSDRGGEYYGRYDEIGRNLGPFAKFLLECGIDARYTMPGTPQKNGVWDLVELPHGCKPIGCKWVFKTKSDSSGQIEKYKARLVVKGYS